MRETATSMATRLLYRLLDLYWVFRPVIFKAREKKGCLILYLLEVEITASSEQQNLA
jgi:hypothetical protein